MLLHCESTQPIYIIGTGPYARELQTWMTQDGHADIRLISHDAVDTVPINSQLMLAFCSMQYRKNFLSETKIQNYVWPAFIHSSTLVTDLDSISPGVIVNPMCVIGHEVVLEDFCLVGALSKVGHGTRVGQNTVISSGTNIAGSTSIGHNVYFSQSCSVCDKLTICNDTYFAMNSVVKKNITKPGRYYGDRKLP